MAEVTRRYCTFSLELTVLSNGVTTTERVDDNGKPFEVTDVPENQHYLVTYLGGVAGQTTTPANRFGNIKWSRKTGTGS